VGQPHEGLKYRGSYRSFFPGFGSLSGRSELRYYDTEIDGWKDTQEFEIATCGIRISNPNNDDFSGSVKIIFEQGDQIIDNQDIPINNLEGRSVYSLPPIILDLSEIEEPGDASIELILLDSQNNEVDKIGPVDLEIVFPNKNLFELGIFCPADITVTDPNGLTINKQTNEITGASYIETDINGDGDPDDLISIPDRKMGNYQITVTPEPDAEATDTYTLKVSAGDTTIVLAEDVTIADIPAQPYVIESTETTINAAPVANSNGPYAGDEGSPITFDASGSYDPDGSIDLYEWDFDGDGVYDVSTATSTAIFTWGDDHAGTVELRVTDNDGLSDTDAASITINNVAPTVSFYVEQPEDFILPYHSLTFNGASTDAGWLDTHAANWDFGDDTIVYGTLTPIGTTTAEHAYVEPGTYTVTLTVTDDDGGTGDYEEEVIVISAEEATGMIIDQLAFSIVPDEAPKGVSQKIESAIAKLGQVIDFLDQGKYCDAIGKLDGMITQIEGAIDQVNEQRCSVKECKGKKCNCIANEDADELIESLEHAKEGAIAIRDLISAEHPECA
jgi:hypothetical protein